VTTIWSCQRHAGPGHEVVERTFVRPHACIRLRIRRERGDDIHSGLLQLACALIRHRQLTASGGNGLSVPAPEPFVGRSIDLYRPAAASPPGLSVVGRRCGLPERLLPAVDPACTFHYGKYIPSVRGCVMNDASGALQEIDRQRMALAAKVRLPWWYVALFTLAMLALLAAPLVARATSWELGNWAVMTPALVVLCLFDLLLGYATGAKLSRGTLRAYPSSRPAGLVMLAFGIIGVAGVHLLVKADMVPMAVVLVVVCTVAVVRCLLWQTAGIRKDIREGRAGAS
jgi:hypothetical protein